MAGKNKLATAIRPHLFAADFSTEAFITTPVGDVAALALVSLSSLRGRVTLPSPWAQQRNIEYPKNVAVRNTFRTFLFRNCSIPKSTV